MKRETCNIIPRSLVSSPERSGALARSCPSLDSSREGARTGAWPIVTLCIATIALLIQMMPGWTENLELDRTIPMLAEPWRLISGHLCHYGQDHFLWDVAVFVVLGTICERISRRQLVQTLLASAILIPAGTLVFNPAFQTYRGLSGIDSALFGLLAAMLVAENLSQRHRIGLMVTVSLFIAFLLKIMLEMRFGVAVFADSSGEGYVPVPLAHMIGLFCGATVHAIAMSRRFAGRMRRYDADAEFCSAETHRWHRDRRRRQLA